MQYMVKIMLMEHEEYEEDDDEFMEASDAIFGKLRILISNYQPPTPFVSAVNASAPFVPAPVDRPVTSLTGLMTAEEILSSEPESLEDVFHSEVLPALPHSAITLLQMSQSPDSGPAEFSKPIEADPGLMGQVLKFVNSSYFGFPNEISNVKQAITLVGVRTIKNFTLWSAV